MSSPATSIQNSAPVADSVPAGQEMHAFIASLYPVCRSITGDGVRQTLQLIANRIPLTIHEVPSGTQVLDWTVPREWNIRDAYIKDAKGERVVDFRQSNLHVMSYSVPVHRTVSLEELRRHLHTLPDRPDWIPYRTSYYKEDWAFCVSYRQFLELNESEYEVCIDSSLAPGSLTYGEAFAQGETADEVLISCHICHPSLCNDNLSGIAVATFLAGRIRSTPHRYSYRFLFVPGTIGSLTWLSRNEQSVARTKHGLVLANVGDSGPFTYKKSRRGDAKVDTAVAHVLRHAESAHSISDFTPYGYDERQYCSPGFNLAVGCLMRTPEEKRPEYHTSADNLDFVVPQQLAETLQVCESVFEVLENDESYVNTHPKGEPQLGRRGLYRTTGGPNIEADNLALLWVLNYSDGQHSLLDIAERSTLPFSTIHKAARRLYEHELLKFANAAVSGTEA